MSVKYFDSEANWTSANPTLAAGSLMLSSDKTETTLAGTTEYHYKVADGSTAWKDLPYTSQIELKPDLYLNATAVLTLAGTSVAAGATGVAGSRGSTGVAGSGSTGVAGTQGSTGVDGVQGHQGNTGIQGSQGATGVA
jgi:hypothetical protein